MCKKIIGFLSVLALVFCMVSTTYAYTPVSTTPNTSWMVGISGTYAYPVDGLKAISDGLGFKFSLWKSFTNNLLVRTDFDYFTMDTLDVINGKAILLYFPFYPVAKVGVVNPYVSAGVGWGEMSSYSTKVSADPKTLEMGFLYKWNEITWFYLSASRTYFGSDAIFGDKTTYSANLGLAFAFDFVADK